MNNEDMFFQSPIFKGRKRGMIMTEMEEFTRKATEMYERLRTKKKDERNKLVKSKSIHVVKVGGGIEYWIAELPDYDQIREYMFVGKFNGYVVFDKRMAPIRMGKRASGIMDYVPVHGGISYANKDRLGCVFGFDTAHFNSGKFPVDDKNWIKQQCGIMQAGLLAASKIEKSYIRAHGVKRLKLVEPIVDIAPEASVSFGVLLKFASGRP